MVLLLISATVMALLMASSLSLVVRGEESGTWILWTLPFVVFITLPVLDPDFAKTMFQDSLRQNIVPYTAGIMIFGAWLIRGITNIN